MKKQPAKHTTDRTLSLSLYQRVLLGSLIAQQTGDSARKALGKEATMDDMSALYSTLRKVRAAPAELVPFTRRLGMDSTLDMAAIAGLSPLKEVVIDGYEAKLLAAFLGGWLKVHGSVGDRDWCLGIIEECG